MCAPRVSVLSGFVPVGLRPFSGGRHLLCSPSERERGRERRNRGGDPGRRCPGRSPWRRSADVGGVAADGTGVCKLSSAVGSFGRCSMVRFRRDEDARGGVVENVRY